MSFLGDLVGSIGTGKALPASQPSKSTNVSSARTSSPAPKQVLRPLETPLAAGSKRKADEELAPALNQHSKSQSAGSNDTVVKKPAPPLSAPRPQFGKPAVSKVQTDTSTKETNAKIASPTVSSVPKPPPSKGSFADLMARAQARSPQQNFGMIKHTKTAPKEKLSRRELERRKEDAKVRADKSGSGGVRKPEHRRSASPSKGFGQNGRVSKAVPSRPVYKGTLGLSARRDKPRQNKKSRYDDYLGTDEEDNSAIEDDEGDGYESSDMEGGFDDLEMEETAALRAARADDAREQALEDQLKREKEERRRRLEALSKKRK